MGCTLHQGLPRYLHMFEGCLYPKCSAWSFYSSTKSTNVRHAHNSLWFSVSQWAALIQFQVGWGEFVWECHAHQIQWKAIRWHERHLGVFNCLNSCCLDADSITDLVCPVPHTFYKTYFRTGLMLLLKPLPHLIHTTTHQYLAPPAPLVQPGTSRRTTESYITICIALSLSNL